jgi:hypothetical protein
VFFNRRLTRDPTAQSSGHGAETQRYSQQKRVVLCATSTLLAARGGGPLRIAPPPGAARAIRAAAEGCGQPKRITVSLL